MRMGTSNFFSVEEKKGRTYCNGACVISQINSLASPAIPGISWQFSLMKVQKIVSSFQIVSCCDAGHIPGLQVSKEKELRQTINAPHDAAIILVINICSFTITSWSLGKIGQYFNVE